MLQIVLEINLVYFCLFFIILMREATIPVVVVDPFIVDRKIERNFRDWVSVNATLEKLKVV